MTQYFRKPYDRYELSGNVNFKLDLSNHASKANLKGVTGVDKH